MINDYVYLDETDKGCMSLNFRIGEFFLKHMQGVNITNDTTLEIVLDENETENLMQEVMIYANFIP